MLTPRRSAVALSTLVLVIGATAAACGGNSEPPPPPPAPTLTHPAGNVASTSLSGGRPYGVAVSRTGQVYTALIGTSTLVSGTLAEASFPDTVFVGDTPPHVAFRPDGALVFATLQTGRAVVVVNPSTNTLTKSIPLPTDGFNLIASQQRVYATTAGGDLYVIDAAPPHAVITILNVGPAANGLALSPNGATLYVSSRDAGTITAIRTSNNTVQRTYNLGGKLQRLAVSPDGATLYAANETVGLDILDLVSGTADTLAFDGWPAYGLGITPDGEQLYVLLPAPGEVRILDRATLAPVGTLTIGGLPRNVAFDSLGTTALVTNEASVTFIE